MNPRTLLVRGGAVLCAAMTAAGCSSNPPKQEFTIPKALCGVPVPTRSLSRLLPASGQKVSVNQVDGAAKGTGLCKVSVDSTEVLVVSTERITMGSSAQRILLHRARTGDQKSTEGGSIAYSDHAAVSLIQCRGSGIEEEDISTFIENWKPGRQDETAMKDLMSGYTAALKKQQPCLKKDD
ncbi:hypothetical protein [Streptomyces sp. MUM 2J]|uniref:hypothetical protein n=1 Tax=Streptomyces sp. MUM 2J TaxID=2791987 RepID=UPI001F03434D|nr:hypothetical protein [Streptomyces sp. MUM 2J]MCH0567274.1 hypothetical protein [Streptomyces sp. MUM 2J]